MHQKINPVRNSRWMLKTRHRTFQATVQVAKKRGIISNGINKKLATALIFVSAVSFGAVSTPAKNYLFSLFAPFEYSRWTAKTQKTKAEIIIPFHIKTPHAVKGIYMSSWVAGTAEMRENLINLAEKTEINSMVVDVKDYSGKISFKTKNASLNAFGAEENRIPDINNFIKELHNKNIYVIARISVFQDDYLANKIPALAIKNKQGNPWKDKSGVSWLYPSNKDVWDYIINIAREAEKAGFDELNFDYIRFPSDGNLNNIKYENLAEENGKQEIIKNFFAYLHTNLKDVGVPLSADLFGLTLWRQDDMNIGQILENTAPYFDYISPMVYPSHYPNGFNGYKNPAEHPYEIILEGMIKGKERLLAASSTPYKLRPWLQDFNLGANYDSAMIKKEKQAVYDAGLNSWLVWNAANRYTEKAYDK